MTINISSYWRLARCDKPTGTWLLLLPCWFGLALAGSNDIELYVLFGAGAFIMRAAGCIINDIIDRKFDAEVERTASRPIASGEITVKNALLFLGILLGGGFLILIQLPLISIFIGLAATPLFTLYPFMKRITYWPQAFLGITFNIGVLVAYSAIAGAINTNAWILYIGCIFWTLGYDTIYAHQDKHDDARIGVKSTALKFGMNTKAYVLVFYLIFLSCLLAVTELTIIPLALLAMACLHMIWQVYRLEIDNPAICMMIFKTNIITGFLVLLSLLS